MRRRPPIFLARALALLWLGALLAGVMPPPPASAATTRADPAQAATTVRPKPAAKPATKATPAKATPPKATSARPAAAKASPAKGTPAQATTPRKKSPASATRAPATRPQAAKTGSARPGAARAVVATAAGAAGAVAAGGALAAPGPHVATPPRAALNAEALIARHGFSPDQVGFALFDPQENAWLETHQPDQPFLPASVSKVPTTVAALDMLGPAFRWQTRLVSAGTVENGVLNGDLYLIGDGDPTLDGRALARLVAGLDAAGIHAVRGRFLYDDSFLTHAPEIEPSQPGDLAYNPGVGALSVDFNRALLRWDPKTGPRFTPAGATPVGDGLSVRVGATPEGGRRPHFEPPPSALTRASAAVAPGESWVLPAPWTGDGSMWLPVKNPGSYTANATRALARKQGLALPPPEPGAAPPTARVLALVRSAPLYEIVTGVLKTSNNMVAEMIGLTTTRRLTGQVLTLDQSAAALNRLYAGSLGGIDWSTFHLVNHSGLSPDSRASPRQIVAILDYAQRYGFHGLDYAALLPRRTWQSDDDDGPAALLASSAVGASGPVPVWAKTGTVYYGRGLAGFVVGGSGRLLTFAIFISDLDRRAQFDARNGHESGADIRAARAWLGRARALERDLADLWRARH
ncbi:D-alanyl-D-alanine carboxypeptidase/D-alanyl-D-alanine-endopeptidase [Pararhodospirillum oryzae]|uniref:Peptidase S13 n=1 Tax=Pararhodospirillum oryzae TaxID=478448 RepID=A0A512H9Y0_9PROT|nr:D-alanyl-D-alanine carboxypeptidase [Pararhodospirillum oryzae]GEO82255.1 peptidase S13 [Pararhodospirillum oryzae]